MNSLRMIIQIIFHRKYPLTSFAFEWLFTFMNRDNVSIQIVFFCKAGIATVTFKSNFFVNCFDMKIQATFLRKFLFADVAFEFLSFMNYIYVLITTNFWFEFSITKITFKFLTLMFCFSMIYRTYLLASECVLYFCIMQIWSEMDSERVNVSPCMHSERVNVYPRMH